MESQDFRDDKMVIDIITISVNTPPGMYTIIEIENDIDNKPIVKIIGTYCLISSYFTFGFAGYYFPNIYVRYNENREMRKITEKVMTKASRKGLFICYE